MKIAIEGFNQKYALSLQKTIIVRKNDEDKEMIVKLDVVDLVILRWFVDFYPKMDKFIIDGKEYAWLLYSKLQEDLPIIDISKRSFADRLKKMVDFEILDFQLCNSKGNLTVYGFGKNYENLIKEGVEKNEGVCGSNNKGYAVQTTKGMQFEQQVDKTINNKSINDNNINNINNNIKENIKENCFDNIFNYWNEKGIIKHKEPNEAMKNAYKKTVKKYNVSDDDIKVAIDHYKEMYDDKNCWISRKYNLETFLSQGNLLVNFLNDGSWWNDYKSKKEEEAPRLNIGLYCR